MAPARRQSNGRSPLVNKQSQITAFFSKPASSTPSSLLSKQNPKSPDLSPNPSPNPDDIASSPSNSPTTPSPLHPKKKKSLLVIPSKPIIVPTLYGPEVVDRRIRIYWPLDDAWYTGCVALYDTGSQKHLVKYDDGEEELVELGKEKIEWVEESVVVKKKFKRLRRGSDDAVVDEKVVVEESNVNVFDDDDGGDGDNVDDDDSEDEDWGKNLAKELEEVAEDDMDVELDEEEEEKVDEKVRNKEKCGKKSVSRKRKVIGVAGVRSEKKSKSGVDGKDGVKVSRPESCTLSESE